jgi:cyanate permease
MLTNRWTVLALVFFIGLTIPTHFQSVAALQVQLSSDVGLSYTQLGVLTGAFMLPGAFVATPIGALAARIGDRNTLALGLAVMGEGLTSGMLYG